MTRIVVVANPDKPEAVSLAETAVAEFAAHGASTYLSTTVGENLVPHRADMAAVFGGDGTVLGAVAGLGPTPPPILAFNLGRLGYLADNPPDRVSEIIDAALTGKLQTSERMMIEARVDSSQRQWTGSALNEFVLASRKNARLLSLSVWVDGEALMDIRGDGIIAATPTGSTAYALSAGGPVASPELAAIILAPLCPHQLANRALVLNPRETIRIEHYSDYPVELLADGRFCLDLERNESLTIRVSPSTVRFLAPARGKYKLLREKLGWGWRAAGDSVRKR